MIKNKIRLTYSKIKLINNILLLSIFISSCVPNVSNQLRSRTSGSSVTNATPKVGQGYVLEDNPIILSKDANLSTEFNLNSLTTVANITTESFLNGGSGCRGLTYCFEVKSTEVDATALQTQNGKWSYDANTIEFSQVNTFYHANKIMKQFIADLDASYLAQVTGYTSLPSAIKLGSTYQFKQNSPVSIYANCDLVNNSFYKQSENEICLGYTQDNPQMKWAQDSSVIYHEIGHFFQYLQLNLNNTSTLNPVSLMGNFNYDEAGSIGEGLSDYFSYYINQRTHFAEWAADRVLGAGRPISEDDSVHIPALAKESGRRLKYPDFIDYNPADPEVPTEDIHISGMVISHFLVALTEDLMSKCGYTKRNAQSQVMILLNESMAELGDQNTKGTVGGSFGRINLSVAKASEWFSKVNPINYRSFSQTLAKNLLHTLGNASLNKCNGTVYTKDNIETLFDEYGLLLFRTYNENRNFSDFTNPAFSNALVTSTNRNNSVLISKELIKLDPTPNASTAFIIDKQESIRAGLSTLSNSGLVVSTSGQADVSYNNGNGKVSPGEIVAIGLNLYNNSNTTMGNAQVLANDWNNLGPTGKPCIFDSTMANDSSWTSVAEGGESCSSVSATAEADFQPICVMQYNGTNSTSWVSQKTFRSKIALNSSQCLETGKDKDCFIRAIKGVDQANFSKLNPKKTWFQTMQNPNSATAKSLDWGNVSLFEVSKHIPPGTVVDCRFRVRFTNCEDCYHDSSNHNYDFKDVDYNGPRPFKIIHLQMTIID